ncbi:MAG: acetyl-CoA carboxylase biotin carboxylase subunit family protein, partial [Gemmiger sp.]
MNFVFISPQFPKTYWNFCDRLKRNGVNVLGIGDSSYDGLCPELKNCLTEYYRVNDLGNYDEMLRAVGYFTFKYGKIDWLESNNEYWLSMDARLRTDFNVNTGAKADFIDNIQSKSRMKESYRKAGVPVARFHMASNLPAARKFVAEVGYPIIAKPDKGCGAEATYKLHNDKELAAFFDELPETPYIMEEFINGTIVSFDGVCDSNCVPLFCTSNYFPVPIMDIVNDNGDLVYWTQKSVPEALKDVGFRTIKAFGAKSRFFHCEFFQLNEDKKGLGKKGDYMALEVNMRPAGGYTPDMINYANSV